MRLKATLVSTAVLWCLTGAATAQTNDVLRDAAQRAITTNPEVAARFNAFLAADQAKQAARGAWLPRVELQADVGQTRDSISTRLPESLNLNRNGLALQITQTLWDGQATRRDVDRLDHERLARYFEFVDASELAALETARAYYDVLRFRRLVTLAEDSYVQHRYVSNQLQDRVRAGVARGVDLEQAGARLALAESNLTTELANLHDVSVRFQRLVGAAPAASMPVPSTLNTDMPASASEAAARTITRNAAVSASIESLRAARQAASLRESAFQPRVEARLRSGGGKNFDGVLDQRRDTTAEITLNWSLFNGGSDQARVRQQINLLNQAADLRDKTCRDARQTVQIAYNDTRKLTDQLAYLDRNVLAIEKTRDAYRQQFDINQRSLLDLLNAENELYTARRAYANAEHDLGTAFARTQAALQQLTMQLGLRRIDTDAQAPSGWTASGDEPGRCPSEAISVPAIDRSDLDARAKRLAVGTTGR